MNAELPGLNKAILNANHALKTSLGYKEFISTKKNKLTHVADTKDFFSLPISEKSNYVHKFIKNNFFSGRGQLPHSLYASSGSSGIPTFWFRNQEQEEKGADIHEIIFTKIFQIDKNENTLLIIGFAMGVWIAGNYTAACARILNKRGFNLTTITPGIEVKDILLVLKDVAQNFKHVILAGYPSFIMDVLQGAKKSGIKIPTSLKLLTAGDSFSEEWRDTVCELTKSVPHPQNVLSLYGSADACVMGFETPLSIYIRKLCKKNKRLDNLLLGNREKQPGIFQYHPDYIFFEEVAGELAITTSMAFPLIRYNIHDQGRVLSSSQLKLLLSQANCLNAKSMKLLKEWPLPFVIKSGRSDVSVTFYALNIYPENLEFALKDKKLVKYVSGKYKVYNKIVEKNKTEQLNIEIETSQKNKFGKTVLQLISHGLADNLSKVNIEYRKLLNILGKKAWPKIKLINKINLNTKDKSLLLIQGKKPKMA